MSKQPTFKDREFFPAGTLIMRQGATPDYAYLIQAGKVSVYTEGAEGTVELARLEPGQIIGEMALVSNAPRAASIKAIEDTTLIVITPKIFKAKVESSDSMVQALMKMLMERVLSSNAAHEALQTSVSSIAKLGDSVREAYEDAVSSLSGEQKTKFQSEVQPKLDAFLKALEQFKQK